MRFYEICLTEALTLGGNMGHIEDLRVPGTKSYDGGRPAAFIVLTKDGGGILYNWGNGNTIEWKELYAKVESEMDTSVQKDMTQIAIHRNGFMIDQSLGDARWSGSRTKHTPDIVAILKELKKRGVGEISTPIWFGNWANKSTARSAGSLGKLLDFHAKPLTRLTMYHGTSSYRAEEIMKNGLRPLPKDERIWKKVHRETPAHRAEAIYLTAALNQAEYYAEQASKMDKRRKNLDSNGESVPVILTCTLGVADMKKLAADDDHLMLNDGSTLEDWRDSLQRMGQVAYKGSLPPSRLRIFKR